MCLKGTSMLLSPGSSWALTHSHPLLAPVQPWPCTSLWGSLREHGGEPSLTLLAPKESRLYQQVFFLRSLVHLPLLTKAFSFPGDAPWFWGQLP